MKIMVVGAGYVGLSQALLLSENASVTIHDQDKSRINQIKEGISPIKDNLINQIFFQISKQLHLKKTYTKI